MDNGSLFGGFWKAAVWNIPLKLILTSNFAKSCLFITFSSVAQTISRCVDITAMSREMFLKDWVNEMLWSKIFRELIIENKNCCRWIMCYRNDTSIQAIVALPMAWEYHHAPRRSRGVCWDSRVIVEATVTEIEVSISTLSRQLNINQISKCCKTKWSQLSPNYPGYSMVICTLLAKLPACTTTANVLIGNGGDEFIHQSNEFVWLNLSWCYRILTMLQNWSYSNPNIKFQLLRFLSWTTVSASCTIVELYTGNSSALCLGLPQSSQVSWQWQFKLDIIFARHNFMRSS